MRYKVLKGKKKYHKGKKGPKMLKSTNSAKKYEKRKNIKKHR